MKNTPLHPKHETRSLPKYWREKCSGKLLNVEDPYYTGSTQKGRPVPRNPYECYIKAPRMVK